MIKIQKDLVELKTKLKLYVDKGRQIGFSDIKPQPLIVTKPDMTKIKPLKKVKLILMCHQLYNLVFL